MRKHFLILMLLTLLPLATWATDVNVRIYAKSANLTYGNTTPTVADVSMFDASGDAAVSSEAKAAIAATLSVTTDRTPGSNVGYYDFTLSKTVNTVDRTGEDGNVYFITLESANASAQFNVVKNTNSLGYNEGTLSANTEYYSAVNGEAQDKQLFQGAPEVHVGNANVDISGEVQYSLDGSNWVSNIADVKANQVGNNYTLYWKVDANGNHSGAVSSTAFATKASINKVPFTNAAANGEFVAPTIVTGQVYTGSPQTPATATTTYPTGGTVYYSLNGSDGWSTTVPTVTNVADATAVYYKVEGCNNYNDLPSTKIDDYSMAKATPVVTIPENAIKASIIYNGNMQSLLNAAFTSNVDGTVHYRRYAGEDKTVYSELVTKDVNAGQKSEVWYNFVPTDAANYNSIDWTKAGEVQLIKATPQLTGGVYATGLVYNGGEQALITTAPTVDFGTLKFRINEGAEIASYSDVKGKDAANYSIQYAVTGTASINDVDWTDLQSVNIAKKSLTVAAKTVTKDWDGQANTLSNLYTATGFVAADEASKDAILAALLDVTVSSTEEMDVTDAGVHTVTLSMKGGQKTNYTVDEFLVQSSQLTINKVNPTLTTAPAAVENLVYTNEAKTLVSAGVVENSYGTVEYKLGEGAWGEITNAQATDAGHYTVSYRVVGDKNHNDLAGADVAASIAKADNTVTVALEGWTYNAQANEPTATATNGTPEITYAVAGGSEWGTYDAIVNGKAGNYTVKAAVAESTNYNAGEATANFTIAQATNTVTVALEGWTYGATANEPTTSATFGEVAVTYAVQGETTFGTYDEIVGGNAGNYTVKAAVTETTDYAAAEATADFTIAKAANTVTVALEGWAYGATANEPTATATDGTPEITYAVAGGSEWGTYDAIVNGKAGSYTVKAAVAESANYNAGEATANFTIAQAANTVTVDIEGWTYGEEAKAPTTSATFGEAVVTYAVQGEATYGTYDEIVNGQAGNYTVKAAVAATTDYAAAEATANFTIARADVVATAPQALTLTYNGAAQNLVTAGEATGAEIQFLNGEEWSTTIPQEKNAGSYTVEYKYVADANHNEKEGGEIAVNIQKVNLKFDLGNKEADWTGEQIPADGTYILSVGALQGDDKIGAEGAFSLAFPEEVKNAGSYVFDHLTATFNNDVENYTILFAGNSQIKVNAVDIVAADFEAPAAVEDALIFNGKAQDLFVAGAMVNNYGEIQYSADGEAWSAELTDALKQGTAAAEYKLYYKVVADGNHNDFVAEAPLTKVIAAKAWEPNVVAFLAGNLEYTYDTEKAKGYDFMPAAADLVLIDGIGKNKKTLTADDYELKITSTKVDEETGEAIVATQAINADTYTFTYTGKGNYAGNVKEYTLTINKKEIEDVFALNVEEAEYTSEDQMPTVSVTNTGSLVENTDYTVEKPAQAINKGQYDVTITLSDNYTFAENENTVVKKFEITPAQILITAGDVEKTYDGEIGLAVAGADALEPELNYAGLKKNDKIADVITNVAEGAVTVTDAAAGVAEYALGIDLTKFTVAEGNYTVKANDVQGKLTIKARDLAITFADRDEEGNYLISKAYGAADDFTDVAALVELDNNVAADADAIIAGIEISRSNADVNAVGKYDGVLEIATEGDVFANYNVTATDKGDFEITAGKLTIALKKAAGKVYDGQAPEASWTVAAADLAVTGMKESDNIADIFTTLPTATIQAPAKDADTYVIKLDGAVTPNYEIGSYLDGQYIITPKALSATVEDQTVQIDAEELPHPAAFVINGAVGGDELNAQLSINASTATAGVFEEGIVLSIDNDNYTLPATYGVLTVIDPTAVAQFDVEDADVFDAIKAAEGATTVNITGREVAAKEWIAFILPFDVTVEQLCDVFGYSIINTYDEKNSTASHMKFQIEQDGVPANTPFIIKPKKAYAADKNMTFEDVVVKAPASAKVEIEVGGNTFVGQYEEFTIVKKDVPNSTYLRAGGWKRAKNSDREIKPFDCYITWPEGSEAPSISIEDEGGVTKIATITTDGRIIEAEGWYTVNGMKLDAAPTEKGVYIKDGKKVVIK